VLRLCHGVCYSHNHSVRLNVDSTYGRNKNVGFLAPIFTKLTTNQHFVLKSFYTEFSFFKSERKFSLSTSKISFVPISKVLLSPYRFSRKLQLINGINWRCRVTSFTHIRQELPKIQAGIHLRH